MKRTVMALVLLLAVIVLAAASPTLASPPSAPPSDSLLVTLAPSALPASAGAQMSRLMPILNSLKKNGHLRGFEPESGANAIRVDAPDSQAALLLHGLPGVAGLVPATAQNVETARTAFRAALAQPSITAAPIALRIGQRPHAVADPPIVTVHETWDTVQGWNFPPGDSVTAVLKDSGGVEKARGTMTVGGDTNFKIWLGQAGIVQGDSVEVTAGQGYAVTIHSVAIQVNFDYVNDKVTGTVASGDTVYVQARGNDTTMCKYDEKGMEAALAGDGSYVADFGPTQTDPKLQMDINRHSQADVSTYSLSGGFPVGWQVWSHAPYVRLQLNPGNNDGYGNGLRPDDELTITLRNNAGVKQTVKPWTNKSDAGFGFRFDQADMLPGDTVEISENGTTWASISIPSLSINTDPVTNLVTGSAPANEPISVSGYHYNRTNGNWEGSCQVLTADNKGSFKANFGKDFVAGDGAEAYYVRDQGNDLRVWDDAPYVELLKDQNLAQGSFHSNFSGELTILVKSASGMVKYKGTGYAFGGWWQQILASKGLPVKLLLGDKVTVTPAPPAKGILTATVAKLTANIDLVNNKITGKAPAKAYLGVFGHYWNGWGYNCDQCFVNTQAGPTGAYSFQFNRDLVAGDYAAAYYIDTTGNRTIARAYSTKPTITLLSAPSMFRRGRDNFVTYGVTGGVNVQRVNLAWDSVSHPDWNYTNWYCRDNCPYPEGGPGDYAIRLGFGFQGRIYFRGIAWVDDQLIFTSPEKWAPAR